MMEKDSDDMSKCKMCGCEMKTKEEKLSYLNRKEIWLKEKLEKVQKAKAELE